MFLKRPCAISRRKGDKLFVENFANSPTKFYRMLKDEKLGLQVKKVVIEEFFISGIELLSVFLTDGEKLLNPFPSS